MKKLTVVLAALLVVSLATPSYAGIDEGDWEVQLGVNWFIGDLITSFGGDIRLGYFVTPEIEIGGWIGYIYRDHDGVVKDGNRKIGDLDWQETHWHFAAFGAYHFETDGEWMPYVGGFVGYEVGDIDFDGDDVDRSGFTLGLMLGIKYFVSEKTTIFIEYQLVWRTEDEWELDESGTDIYIEDDQISHLIMVGISVLF